MVERLDPDNWEKQAAYYEIRKCGETRELTGFPSVKYHSWRSAVESVLNNYALIMTDIDGVKRRIFLQPAIDDEFRPWRFRELHDDRTE